MSSPFYVHQIRHNCDVSDARHCGLFSICGLALRLRDLYKWEHGLPPWREDPSDKVLEWIGEREDSWEELADKEYQPLQIGTTSFDPFDTVAINSTLEPEGFFYGAGYAQSLKPTFFLARIHSKEQLAGRTVRCMGREYARDLLTLPAFCQDGDVILRMDAARMYLWDQMAYAENSSKPALQFALGACCGITKLTPKAYRTHLDRIIKIQEKIYIRHEIGELADTVFDRSVWQQLVADHAHTPVELLVRVLKDMLADTDSQGPLPDIAHRQDRAGLGLYIAFCRSMTLALFPELKIMFETFQNTYSWKTLNEDITGIRKKAVDYSREVLEIHQLSIQSDGGEQARIAAVNKAIAKTMSERGLLR